MPCCGSETAASRHWAAFEMCSLRAGRGLSRFVSPDGKTAPEGLVVFLVCFFGGVFGCGGGFFGFGFF